jgi:hypothetical protein
LERQLVRLRLHTYENRGIRTPAIFSAGIARACMGLGTRVPRMDTTDHQRYSRAGQNTVGSIVSRAGHALEESTNAGGNRVVLINS